MLDKLILIEGNKTYKLQSKKELVKLLLGDNYYNLDKLSKLKLLVQNSYLKSANTNLKCSDISNYKDIDLSDKFVILDEDTYILSLLRTNRITLLERVDSNIYTKYLDTSKIEDNYIIINNFALEILTKYLKEKDEL
jgi:hypothetical protein